MNSANSSNIKESYFPQDQLETPISQIYKLKISQKIAIETNFTLQIIGIKKLDKKPSMQDSNRNNNMFCLNLSDNIFSYNGFIVVDRNATDLNILDLIEVYSLNILPTEKQQKLFVIKSYKFVGKTDGVIGNPQNIANLVFNEEIENQEDQGKVYSNIARPSHNAQQIYESNNLTESNYSNNKPNFNRSGLIEKNENEHENINSYNRDPNSFMNNNSNIPSRNQRISIPPQNLNFIKKNPTNNNSFMQPIDVRGRKYQSINSEDINTPTNSNLNSTNYLAKKRLRENENQNNNIAIPDQDFNGNISSMNQKEFVQPRTSFNNANKELLNVKNPANLSENPIPKSTDPINKSLYTPLNHLTTFSKDFTILVRVIKKSSIKNFNTNSNTNRPPGRLFNLNIMDKEKSEMQITCFNRGVDKFYDFIEENKLYSIYGGYIKLNDRKFYSGANKSEYKLVIDENCLITEMQDDGTIPYNSNFTFTKISKIFEIPLYSVVDLCVFILECGETTLKSTKNGDLFLRKLTVCDDSECKVEFTLWRAHAQIELQRGQFMLIKNAKVGEFNGRNFSSFDDTSIIINPENCKEIQTLKLFMQSFSGEFKNVSTMELKKASSSNNSNDNISAAPVYFMQEILDMIEYGTENFESAGSIKKIKGTVTQMIHNDRNFYAGCPDNGCKRKSVFNDETGEWLCNYCGKAFNEPAYYYNLSLRVKDCSCEHWIDLFGTNAEKILKISAEEYRNALMSGDFDKLREVNKNIEFKTFYFCVKPKIQQFNGNYKKKIYAYKFEQVDDALETKRLIEILGRKFDAFENTYRDNDDILDNNSINNGNNNVINKATTYSNANYNFNNNTNQRMLVNNSVSGNRNSINSKSSMNNDYYLDKNNSDLLIQIKQDL